MHDPVVIILKPPAGMKLGKRLYVDDENHLLPDLKNGGRVRVFVEHLAKRLERDGWTRDTGTATKALVDDDLLKGAIESNLRHSMPGVGAPPKERIEFGEVEHGLDVNGVNRRVRVVHDRKEGGLILHGVAVDLDDVPSELRASFLSASTDFDAAQTVAEQTTAREAIGRVVAEVLRRDTWLAARVKERLAHERFSI